MQALAHTFLLVYAALFPIVNPVGSAPIFLGLTQSCTDQQRSAMARRVAFNSFFLLLGSLFVGSHVLEFFGISLPVVRIGGGLAVMAFGWKLMNSESAVSVNHNAPNTPAPDPFYPLTMPLTVGPGSIAVAITLGSQRPRVLPLGQLTILSIGAVVGLLAVAGTVYLCYRFARRLMMIIGEAGTNAVVRLSAFILLCIGIQIIWSGWSDLVGLAQ